MSTGVYMACDDCMEKCDAATLRGGHFCTVHNLAWAATLEATNNQTP